MSALLIHNSSQKISSKWVFPSRLLHPELFHYMTNRSPYSYYTPSFYPLVYPLLSISFFPSLSLLFFIFSSSLYFLFLFISLLLSLFFFSSLLHNAQSLHSSLTVITILLSQDHYILHVVSDIIRIILAHTA